MHEFLTGSTILFPPCRTPMPLPACTTGRRVRYADATLWAALLGFRNDKVFACRHASGSPLYAVTPRTRRRSTRRRLAIILPYDGAYAVHAQRCQWSCPKDGLLRRSISHWFHSRAGSVSGLDSPDARWRRSAVEELRSRIWLILWFSSTTQSPHSHQPIGATAFRWLKVSCRFQRSSAFTKIRPSVASFASRSNCESDVVPAWPIPRAHDRGSPNVVWLLLDSEAGCTLFVVGSVLG